MRTTLPAMLLVAVLGAAACGGGTDEPAGDAPRPTDTTTEPATGPTTPATEPTPQPSADPTTDPAAGSADCSGGEIDLVVADQPQLPDAVDRTRRLLTDAALRCDEQLLHTAATESSQFTYSFGDDGDFVGFLRDREAEGEPVFAFLAQLLQTTPALNEGDIWVWPRVHTGRAEDTTDEAWEELVPIFGDERVERARSGDGYLDWRVGIATDGEFRFFVAGD